MREIQPPGPKSGEHPWVAAFLKALAREDVASVTVRGYRSDLRVFTAWYGREFFDRMTRHCRRNGPRRCFKSCLGLSVSELHPHNEF